MFAIVKALSPRPAFFLVPRPQCISSPSQILKTLAGARAESSGLLDLGTSPGNVLSSFPLEKENLRPPGRSVRQRQPRAPHPGPVDDGVRPPGCFASRRSRLTPVPNAEAGRVPCGSRPRPARNPRRHSLPRITPAPWGGRVETRVCPPRPPERRTGPPGSQEVPGRPAYPDLLSPGGPAGPGTRDPRALAPGAGYLLSLRSYRGGARRGEAGSPARVQKARRPRPRNAGPLPVAQTRVTGVP